MNDHAYTVMVVDDEPANVTLMERTLGPHYSVLTACSGAECLEYINNETPDLILLDVRMPGMDGYEVCNTLKSMSTTKDIPVIFLSAHTQLNDKLKGYEVGGEDYITKPCELDVVLAKVKRSIANNKALTQNRDMVMMSMTNTGELGVVNQFYESSFSCTTPEALAQQIIASCHSFGLECCLQIRTSGKSINVSSTKEQCTPLEVDLMNQIKGAERIFHFGKRSAFNFDEITLIIKNMPRDDEDKCGRLNDHLASLVNGAEARILNIDVESQQRKAIMKELNATLSLVDTALKDIKTGMTDSEKKTARIISHLFDEMNQGFSSLALTEEQEDFFIRLVNSHMDKIISLYTSNTEAEVHFSKISKVLSSLIIHDA